MARKLNIVRTLSDYPVWEGVLRTPETWGEIMEQRERENYTLTDSDIYDMRYREARENGELDYIFG